IRGQPRVHPPYGGGVVAVHGHRARRWLAGIAGASLVASGLGLAGASAQTPQPMAEVGATDKISEEVSAQIEEKGAADFWVRFDARPDMSQFTSITDWDARGKAVFDAL